MTLPPEAGETTEDVTKALSVRLEAKPGKEADVAEFLCSADGRQAHLDGRSRRP